MRAMESKDKSILDYIDIAKRRKVLLILPALIGLIIAGFVAMKLPSYYRSTTMILIEGQKIPDVYVKTTDQTPLSSRLNTLKQEIISRTRLQQVATELNLDKEKVSPSGLRSYLFSLIGHDSEKELSNNNIVDRMKSNIEVKVIAHGTVMTGGYRNPDAFSVSYIARDPRLAMEVTKKLTTLFIQKHSALRERFAEGTSQFLNNELEVAKRHLRKQENSIEAFRTKHMGALPEQLDSNLRTLDRLQLEFQTVSSEIRTSLKKKNRLEARMADSTDADTPHPSELQVQLSKAEKELVGLSSRYNDNYPDIIMTKNRIKDLRERLLNSYNTGGLTNLSDTKVFNGPQYSKTYNDLQEVKGSLDNLNKRMEYIKKQTAMYEHRVEVTPENEQRLANIKRDYTISLKNYQSLLEKKLNARLSEHLEKSRKGESFKVLDPAFLPESPFKPNRVIITLYGGAAGLALGIGIILMLEFLNPAFMKAEDFAGVVPVPVLITIPTFSFKGKSDRRIVD